MKILISGASGLLGGHLAQAFHTAGHTTAALVRRGVRNPESEVRWDPANGILDRDPLTRFDAVVHLAGKSIAGGLWTRSHMDDVYRSRMYGTRLLANALAALGEHGPRLLISASAVGFYGDRGETVLDESSESGTGFLAELCRDWEKACDPAREAGLRVVHPRIGIVLAADGGFLTPLKPLFRLGLGARMGSGHQYMSWVHVEDLDRAFVHLLDDESIEGPVNVTSPVPSTNRELTEALARALHRPAPFAVPAFLLKLLPHAMGREMFLASQRALPRRLLDSGFSFHHPSIGDALSNLLD